MLSQKKKEKNENYRNLQTISYTLMIIRHTHMLNVKVGYVLYSDLGYVYHQSL